MIEQQTVQALEHATDVAACVAVSTPFWLHWLSDGGQFLLTTLGIVWLVIQIGFKLHPLYVKLRKKPK